MSLTMSVCVSVCLPMSVSYYVCMCLCMCLYVCLCSVHLKAVESVSRWISTYVPTCVYTPETGRTSARLTLVVRSLLSQRTSSHTSSLMPNRSTCAIVYCCLLTVLTHWVTSLFGLVFRWDHRWLQNTDWDQRSAKNGHFFVWSQRSLSNSLRPNLV